MTQKKVLLIGGSLNQTKMMHEIGQQLISRYGYLCFYSPYYGDPIHHWFAKRGFVDWTVMGGVQKRHTVNYLRTHQLNVDEGGKRHNYDLVLTGSDLIVPKNIRNKKLVLVQEGMTDPETLMFHLVKWLKLPRYFASTSTNGLSDLYSYFCVASDGYKEHFVRKGVRQEKVVVTGIPNFDFVDRYRNNSFPHRNFALIATSDARETFKIDNRRKFLRQARRLAGRLPIVVKLHPNERFDRAKREIAQILPGAMVYESGSVEEMIANCSILICQYSTVVYVGLALGKEVHSYFDLETLRKLKPIQNRGTSSQRIAQVCYHLVENLPLPAFPQKHENRHNYSSPHGLHTLTP